MFLIIYQKNIEEGWWLYNLDWYYVEFLTVDPFVLLYTPAFKICTQNLKLFSQSPKFPKRCFIKIFFLQRCFFFKSGVLSI